jgi:hypothetical protein
VPRTRSRMAIGIFSFFAAVSSLIAQDVNNKTVTTAPVITATASVDKLRFTAPASVVQMQLQVYSKSGQVLFDVSAKGNVLDWTLQDSAGVRLGNDAYLCVVTVKSLSGRLSKRIGSVSVAAQQVELHQVQTTQLTSAQQQAVGPIAENSSLTILKAGEAEAATVLANNGSDGQIIRDRGALSFRLGDFFSGSDKEQMRLTEEGNLGIGTAKPKVKLDVAGMIRAREGFLFSDGSKLNVNEKGGLQLTNSDGSVVPNAAGSGTKNRVAKWTETGGAGTLGDSAISEVNGKVGIGTTNPGGQLHIFGTATQDVFAGMGPDLIAGPAFNYGYAGFSFGRGAGFFNVRPDAGATPPNPSLRFATANVERMIVTNVGNVGIGTTGPTAKLDVAGNINTSTQYNIGGNRVLSVPFTSNVFAGVNAGLVNTGIFNSFFGANAGQSNTEGISNSFFGTSAGQSNTEGINNSFFGGSAGFANTTGSSNVFIGASSGSSNTFEDNNTFIGTKADGAADITNATAIGFKAKVTQSNSLVLGSINGINFATADTNVGIGTTAPGQAALTIQRSGSAFVDVKANSGTQEVFVGADAGGGILSTISNHDLILRAGGNVDRVRIKANGNVGIGTIAPASKLHISGGNMFIAHPNSLIITSANGNCWFITVSDAGALSTVSVPCPS